MFHLFKNHHTSLGIDIGEYTIAIVELRKNHDHIEMISQGLYDLSNNNPREISKIIIDHLTQKNIISKHVYLSFPSKFFIRKIFSFNPELNESDIELELSANQQKYFPGIQEKLVFDFIDPEHNRQNVRLFAMRESQLFQYTQIMKQVQLKPICLEPNSYALLRTIPNTEKNSFLPNQVMALLNISKNSRIIIFNPTEILYEQDFQNRLKESEISKTIQNFYLNFPDYHLEKIYVIESLKKTGSSLSPPEKHNNFLTITQKKIPIISINPFQKILNANPKKQLLCAFGTALRSFL